MKNKLIIGSGFALAAAFAVISSAQVFAYRGDAEAQGPNYTPERHEAMTAAFEKGDYQAWTELMGDRGRVRDVVTEENFGRFAEMHQLRQDGKLEEADAIRAELGLGQQNGQGGQRRGGGCNR